MAFIYDDLKTYNPSSYVVSILKSKATDNDGAINAITFCWETGRRVKFIFDSPEAVETAITKIIENMNTDILINKEYLSATEVHANNM